MFRISRYLHALNHPAPHQQPAPPSGPVVIWNLVRRCNLTCKHCYATSADKDFPGELSRSQIFTVMDDLRAYHVPVLILSGGEPLLHPDLFLLSRRAKEQGFYTALSSNGTLINEENLHAITAIGYDYIGISLDGMRTTHDRFRRCEGAFDAALHGIRLCRDAGLRVGLRFTLTQENAADLPALLTLMEQEGIDKFYLSHLNYAGRGYKNRKEDAHQRITREAMDRLFTTVWEDVQQGRRREFVTGNNDADGAYLLRWAHHHLPDQTSRLESMLRHWGGNASGIQVANIDNEGRVHPDTMWWDYTLGNVKQRPFSAIWEDRSDPLMAGLKQRQRPLEGRCATCHYRPICNGNSRTRAWRTSGNPWAEDPGCYLSDEEIAPPPATTNPTRSRLPQVAALLLATALSAPLIAPQPAQASSPPEPAHELFITYCSVCHGSDRLGGSGPALLPENLHRLRRPQAHSVIAEGRPATQMPGFNTTLSEPQIAALSDYIYTPLPEPPHWGEEQIHASQIVYHPLGTLPDTPQFSADIANLFIVVELGDHHATLLDGDSFEPIHRFPTRYALHGGPKYAEGGRYVYFASRDGWISKFDLYNLTYTAEIRAGINTRNLAVSHDGRFVLVANYLPHTLVLLDARDLTPIRVIPVTDQQGNSSRVSAVYTADPRYSFIVALKDIPQVWEISYRIPPPRGFGIWVHDYRIGAGGEPDPRGNFPIRRIHVKDYLDDFFIDQEYRFIAGSNRDGGGQVVDLDLGRAVRNLELPEMPHLSSAISWQQEGRTLLAAPNIQAAKVTLIDTSDWTRIKEIETLGPGFFMRSHENSRYAWTDVFFGEHRDAMHVIDKQTLEIVKTLRPAPGKTSAHVEFTRDGRYALVSIWDDDGALVIYDGETLEEVKRIPMKRPSGKYNVYNKLSRSEGTSH